MRRSKWILPCEWQPIGKCDHSKMISSTTGRPARLFKISFNASRMKPSSCRSGAESTRTTSLPRRKRTLTVCRATMPPTTLSHALVMSSSSIFSRMPKASTIRSTACLSDCSLLFFLANAVVVCEVEEADIEIEPVERLVQSIGIGIGDQHLAETPIAEQLEQVTHALRIELVKNIIQQQDRTYPAALLCEIELGELQCDQIGFLLALRSVAFQRLPVDRENEIVLMDAGGGVLRLPVAIPGRS